jgi:two-component system KDP operon response regulator KdpE
VKEWTPDRWRQAGHGSHGEDSSESSVTMVEHTHRDRALILAVEDDPDIQRLIARRLREAGFEVITADTASDGFHLFGERLPDLLMLDLNLPDGSGLGLVKQVRAASDTPIIIVSANADERSLVACLDAGADDYVTKPFRMPELLARVRSVMRRKPRPPEPDELVIGSLDINLAERRVHRFGQELHLTPTEYRLLVQFARSPNRVFTHGTLLTAVWGPEYAEEPHILRVTLNRLRGKLGSPGLIANRPAVGYTLEPDT